MSPERPTKRVRTLQDANGGSMAETPKQKHRKGQGKAARAHTPGGGPALEILGETDGASVPLVPSPHKRPGSTPSRPSRARRAAALASEPAADGDGNVPAQRTPSASQADSSPRRQRSSAAASGLVAAAAPEADVRSTQGPLPSQASAPKSPASQRPAGVTAAPTSLGVQPQLHAASGAAAGSGARPAAGQHVPASAQPATGGAGAGADAAARGPAYGAASAPMDILMHVLAQEVLAQRQEQQRQQLHQQEEVCTQQLRTEAFQKAQLEEALRLLQERQRQQLSRQGASQPAARGQQPTQAPAGPAGRPAGQPPHQHHHQHHQRHAGGQQTISFAPTPVTVLAAEPPEWSKQALKDVDSFWRPLETLAVIETVKSDPAPGTHGQLQMRSCLFTLSGATFARLANKEVQARLVCVQPSDTVSPTATPAAAAAGPSGGPSPAAPASTACASAPSASPAAASPGPLVGPRCHWYAGSSVLLNSVQVEVTKEDRITLLLPHNQADQATDVSSSLRPGINRLTLFWPVGVAGAVVVLRLCTPLAPADLARALAPPLPLPQLLQLLRQYMAGELPPADDNEDEQQEGAGSADGDNTSAAGQDQGRVAATAAAGGEQGPQGVQAGGGEADGGALESGPVTVSLRCPLSGCLVASPAHFGRWCDRNPLAFFDRDAFLQTAQHTGSWLCPATGKLGSANDLRPHAYLCAVLATLDANGCRHRVEAVEVVADGTWRPKDTRVPYLSVDWAAAAGAGTAAAGAGNGVGSSGAAAGGGAIAGVPPRFDVRLLDPQDDGRSVEVVDLTDD